jgi:hypothetical protein
MQIRKVSEHTRTIEQQKHTPRAHSPRLCKTRLHLVNPLFLGSPLYLLSLPTDIAAYKILAGHSPASSRELFYSQTNNQYQSKTDLQIQDLELRKSALGSRANIGTHV